MTNNKRNRTYHVTTMAIFASAAAFSFTSHKKNCILRKRVRNTDAFQGRYGMRTSKQDDIIETVIFPSWDSTVTTQILNPEFTSGLSSLDDNRSSSSSLSMTGETSLTYEEQRHQFEMHVGKAVDTLRHDYPNILVVNPDFSIYDPHITVVDPSGVKLHNLHNYRTSLSFLHAIINFFYCTDKSGLTFRVHYDGARRNIRVSWNAILIPRIIYGGIRNRLHVDGISVYELDYTSGLITQHRIERLLINDAPVQAPQGIFLAIAREAMSGPEGIPILSSERYTSRASLDGHFVMEFQPGGSFFTNHNSSSLFSTSSESSMSLSSSNNNQDADVLQSLAMNHPLFNIDGFEKKNASRKKFGLPPITPKEYIDIQTKVQEMDIEQRAKASSVTDVKQGKPKGNVFDKIFGGKTFQSTCESNFDCERPEICCDFGFVKRCCRSGLPVFDGNPSQLQPRLVPVPASSPGLPRGGPEGMDDDYY